MLVLTCLLLTCKTSNSQSESPGVETWQKLTYNYIEFEYPKDWRFHRDSVPGSIFLRVTGSKNSTTLNPFEIAQVDKRKYTFEDFKKQFFMAIKARTHNETKILYKTDTTLKSLPSVYVNAVLFYKSDQIPAKIYALKGRKYFYIVTILSYKQKDSITEYLDSTTSRIFESLQIDEKSIK
jgi:hypothetical protein